MGEICPVCMGCCGYREIPSYDRKVIDLFPFREGRVRIQRFLCRTQKRTFSLLPHQLIPYVHYTARSVLMTLVIAQHAQENMQMGLFGVAEKRIDEDTKVTGYLIACWLVIACRSPLLQGDEPEQPCTPQGNLSGALRRLWAAVLPDHDARDPPAKDAWLDDIDHRLKEFAQRRMTFPIGCASQDRPVLQHRCA